MYLHLLHILSYLCIISQVPDFVTAIMYNLPINHVELSIAQTDLEQIIHVHRGFTSAVIAGRPIVYEQDYFIRYIGH